MNKGTYGGHSARGGGQDGATGRGELRPGGTTHYQQRGGRAGGYRTGLRFEQREQGAQPPNSPHRGRTGAQGTGGGGWRRGGTQGGGEGERGITGAGKTATTGEAGGQGEGKKTEGNETKKRVEGAGGALTGFEINTTTQTGG